MRHRCAYHILWGSEMNITRAIAAFLILGGVTTGAAEAQIGGQQPAEFPPSSYRGKQYVDSAGCVFIRAGIDGNVTWVPRVNRKRQILCGYEPTDLGTLAESAPPQTPAPPVVEITLDAETQPAPKPEVAKVVAAPVPPAAVVPAEAPREVVPQTAVIVADMPPPLVTPQPPQGVQAECPGVGAVRGGVVRGDSRQSLRCDGVVVTDTGSGRDGIATAAVAPAPAPRPVPVPRPAPVIAAASTKSTIAVAPVTVPRAAAPVAPAPVAAPVSSLSPPPVLLTPQTRVVPKQVADSRATAEPVRVPKGYVSVWEDDRLNPYRAEQNLAGRERMLRVWTNTVPRRLIDQRTGRDVTASVALVYPYLDLDVQRRELGKVKLVRRNGQLIKQVVRNRPLSLEGRSSR